LKYFAKETKLLINEEAVPTNSSILNLNPFLDDSDILRMGDRLRESSLFYASKHSILLSGNYPFVVHHNYPIVMHEHVKHLLQATPATVHERYWFTSARNIIR